MKRFLMLLAVLAGVFSAVAAHAGRQRVLVIHSYDPGLPWVAQCNRGIDGVLAELAELERVYLDTKRIHRSEFQERADKAMQAFDRFRPDLVMVGDDDALRLLGQRIAATGKPLVYFGINNNPREYFSRIPDNVTGVLERVPVFAWIRHLKRIVPGAEHALVLLDGSATAEAVIRVSFGDRMEFSVDGVRVEYEVAADWALWQRVILSPHGFDFITMPLYHDLKDDAGVHVPVEEVVRWTTENSSVPVFAYQDYAVGENGVVGAFVIFGETHAQLAALMARDILEGKNPRLPTAYMDQDGMFFFNESRLTRFGLTLPEDIRRKAVFR